MKRKFSNAKIYRNCSVAEMIVENGKVAQIGSNLPKCDEEIDPKGKFILPPYVGPHLHLDYVYTLAGVEGIGVVSGTLYEVIENWSKYKATMIIKGMKKLVRKGIEDGVSQGVQFTRAQTDVTDPKFIGFKALMELREEMEGIVDIRVVTSPQNGMYTYKSGKELVEEALKMGADVIGGIPHYEPAREFGEKFIHDIVELAMKYNVLTDVHCDKTDDTMTRSVEALNVSVYLENYGTKATANHTCSFGSADNSYVYRMFDMFKRSKMDFISCPTEDAYLQGRQDTHPKRRDLTRIKEFVYVGISVALAQDSINDSWYPLGSGNMINILDNAIHLSHCASLEEVENAFDMIIYNGAKCMNIHDVYEPEEGKDTNLIILDGNSSWDCIRRHVSVLASVRKSEFLLKKKSTEHEIPLRM